MNQEEYAALQERHWQLKQKTLFKELLDNSETATISLPDLIALLDIEKRAWYSLNNVICNQTGYLTSYRPKALNIAILPDLTGKMCLILHISIWHYIIVDLETQKCLSKEDAKGRFNKDFFEKFFNEFPADDNSQLYYSFASLDDEKVKELLDVYNEYSSVFQNHFLNTDEIVYLKKINCTRVKKNSPLSHEEIEDTIDQVSLHIRLSDQSIQITFQSSAKDNENIIYKSTTAFFDSSLKALGSNSTELPQSKVEKMAEYLADIQIPMPNVPEFIKNRLGKKSGYYMKKYPEKKQD